MLWDTVYGPVQSRRLGLSLGVNLLPADGKVCSFECIYCECGWTGKHRGQFAAAADVIQLLRRRIIELGEAGTPPDVITFAGNGEPTLHPDFEAIIDDTMHIRDKFVPLAKVSVLSNGTQIGNAGVRRALMRVDNNIIKLDSAFDTTVQLIDKPRGEYSVAQQVELLKLFKGQIIIQTLFLRGEFEGQRVDNTTEREVAAWLDILNEIKPRNVMVYTIDRPTPAKTLEKVNGEELEKIRERVRAQGAQCE